MEKVTLRTPRLLLRPQEPGDAAATHAYAGDPVNCRFMAALPRAAFEETEAFVRQAAAEWEKAEPEFFEFTVTLDGSQIGTVSLYLDESRREGELAWILHRDYWGKGYAAEAAGALKRYAVETLGLRRLVAHCDARNAASAHVMEKLGMALSRSDGVRTDKQTGEAVGELEYVWEAGGPAMKFILRPWRMEDAPTMARYADNPKIASNLRDAFPYPYTLADAEGYIRACVEAGDDRRLARAIEIGGEAVGSIGLFLGSDVYRKSAELGYWLGEPFWGRGVMAQAIRMLCGEAFARFDLVRIHAEPFAHNQGSRRALEKAGFTLEGVLHKSVYKNGAYHDSCLYALVRE